METAAQFGDIRDHLWMAAMLCLVAVFVVISILIFRDKR